MIFFTQKQQAPVQILDSGFNVLFTSAHPLNVTTEQEKRPTEFQVESGETRSDHVVVNPKVVTIDFALQQDSRNEFENIRQAFASDELVTIQTRLSTFENMLIVSIPSVESADTYQGGTVSVRFQEWREIQPEYGEIQQAQVAKPEQSDTVKRGKQTPAQATPQQEAKVEKQRRSVLDRIIF